MSGIKDDLDGGRVSFRHSSKEAAPGSSGTAWHEGGQLRESKPRPRGPKGYKRADERIFEELCDRLSVAPSVDATDVEVQVHDGAVTLAGAVPDPAMRGAAQEIAESVVGVLEVHNRISYAASSGS